MIRSLSLVIILILFGTSLIAQQAVKLKVQLDKASESISPYMWGVFFEDINLSADGGIYAELIKNRSFEFPNPFMGWHQIEDHPENTFSIIRNNKGSKKSRVLKVHKSNDFKCAIQNEGFRGMGIKAGEDYEFSLIYRNASPQLKLKIELLNQQDKVVANTVLNLSANKDWQESAAILTVSETSTNGKLNVRFLGTGDVEVDMISLFPTDTWKGRRKGLRKDMVEILAALKPDFIRFPGGCIVEGMDLSNRFQWKNTIGPINKRKLIMNRWNVEFSNRLTPDYFQSFGMGFYEYFLLCADLGAEPVPILNCGMACQFNSGELASMEDLDEYIQDAIDLIEFANGDTSTYWGKIRSEMGHPKPFNLKMLGIGNENWGPQYIERLQAFQKALNSSHPEIQLIASGGPDPDGARFDYLNKELRKMKLDIIDEHFYRPPSWFYENSNRYDKYDRNGPKIFAGEYASHTSAPNGPNRNTWEAALSEAAFLTGLERNGDIVTMSSYAPLFAHVSAWQWSPNLIWFDNMQVYGSPSYYVQQLFSLNKGCYIVPVALKGMGKQNGLYASSVYDDKQQKLIVKVVNSTDSKIDLNFDLQSQKPIHRIATKTILTHKDLSATNSIAQPQEVYPQTTKYKFNEENLLDSLHPYSLTVYEFSIEK